MGLFDKITDLQCIEKDASGKRPSWRVNNI